MEFEGEEEGQRVTTTYHPGFTTEFKDGEPHVHGDVTYEFENSGNVYECTIDVKPCKESATGHCITVVARGGTLGDEPVRCQNY